MNGERSVRASARSLWAFSCGETKIDMGRAWGAYAHTLNVRAVCVLLLLSIDCLGARVCVCGRRCSSRCIKGSVVERNE